MSIDGGASTTPSTLSFVGFSGVDNNSGVVTISGSNFTYYAGNLVSIDGSNNISCDLSAGYGVSISNVGVVQNTKPAPAYRVAPSGGSDTTYQPDTVTRLRFLRFNHAFGSNLLTISPEPQASIQAGDGISVSGRTITNTHKMCNVVVYSGITETIIPGDQITALQLSLIHI